MEELNKAESQPAEKQHQWDEKMTEMLKPDQYGYVLNEGIRDTVVALQLLGFNTTQSDQGNYSPSPWVQIEAQPPKDVYVGEHELKQSFMEEHAILPDEINEHSPLFNREKQVEVETGVRKKLSKENTSFTPEYIKWRLETLELAEKLKSQIDDFYATHLSNDESTVRVNVRFPYQSDKYPPYIHDIPFLLIDFVDGKGVDEITKKKDREQVSMQCREEMRLFTQFLKEQFFSKE